MVEEKETVTNWEIYFEFCFSFTYLLFAQFWDGLFRLLLQNSAVWRRTRLKMSALVGLMEGQWSVSVRNYFTNKFIIASQFHFIFKNYFQSYIRFDLTQWKTLFFFLPYTNHH